MAKVFAGTEAWTAFCQQDYFFRCGRDVCITFGCREVDDITIRLEHVDLLDGLDRLHVHLLQCRLQLLVVRAGALVDLLYLSPRCALASACICQSCFILVSPTHISHPWLEIRNRG